MAYSAFTGAFYEQFVKSLGSSYRVAFSDGWSLVWEGPAKLVGRNFMIENVTPDIELKIARIWADDALIWEGPFTYPIKTIKGGSVTLDIFG
jgi:hypothetical protein